MASITNRDISRVHRWTYPQEKGGSGGIIPPKAQDMLLAAAPAYGVSLSRDEFFHPVAEPLKKTKTSQLPSAFNASKTSLKNSSKGLRKTNEAVDAA